MPISKRTGKWYAKGSSQARGGWEPRTCCICHQPVVLTHKPALRFHHSHTRPAVAWSWHATCEQPGWPHLNPDLETKTR